MLRVIAWIYAVCGSLYFGMYLFGSELVEKFAVVPLWLMMVIAPILLGLLIVGPVFSRFVK